MKTIEYGFTDKNGYHYDDLKVIKYDSLEELKKESMHWVISSTKEDTEKEALELTEGINIYQFNNKQNVAYRLYKDMKYYEYISHEDDCKLINMLLKKQNAIKLTEFPNAIIAIRNSHNYDKYHVIGTQIPYYYDYKELYAINEVIEQDNKEKLIYIYEQIVNILRELKNTNIIYDDIHMANIMIRLSDLNIKLIDFEYNRIKTNGFEYNMLSNLKGLIYEINNKLGIYIDGITRAKSFEEIENIIDKEKQKIRNR